MNISSQSGACLSIFLTGYFDGHNLKHFFFLVFKKFIGVTLVNNIYKFQVTTL